MISIVPSTNCSVLCSSMAFLLWAFLVYSYIEKVGLLNDEMLFAVMLVARDPIHLFRSRLVDLQV